MEFNDDDLKRLKRELNEDLNPTVAETKALVARLEAAERVAFEGEGCVNCPNQGWYIVASNDEEPLQEQCQFCIENPVSRFNLEEAWKRSKGE